LETSWHTQCLSWSCFGSQATKAATTQQQVACPGRGSKPHVGAIYIAQHMNKSATTATRQVTLCVYVGLGNLWHPYQRGMKTLNSTTLTQSHRSLPQTQHPLLKSTSNFPTGNVTHESSLIRVLTFQQLDPNW